MTTALLAIIGAGGLIFIIMMFRWAVTIRGEARAEVKLEQEKKVSDAAKEVIRQDRIVTGNPNIERMSQNLSAALRRKRDS
jgi:hypothetical protein